MKIYNAKKTKPIIPPKDKNNSPKKNKIMEEPKKHSISNNGRISRGKKR